MILTVKGFEELGTWRGFKIGRMTMDGQTGLALFSHDEKNFQFFLEEDPTKSEMINTLDQMAATYGNTETGEAGEGISRQSHVGEA